MKQKLYSLKVRWPNGKWELIDTDIPMSVVNEYKLSFGKDVQYKILVQR